MIYLTDNDIVGKLAACDLLDDSLTALGANRADVLVLPSLKFRFGYGLKRPAMERKHGAVVVARVLEFLIGVGEVRDASTNALLGLEDIIGIDQGEAVLISAAISLSDSVLLTGDKRCLKTLVEDARCHGIATGLQGRVLCFEQVMLRLIDHLGFARVQVKVAPNLHCDAALRAAFGSGMESTEANAVASLKSYVVELRNLPIDLLAP